jgi:glucokinase
VAIANPVEGDRVRMTNYHWQFSIEQMRQRLGFQSLVVVNDFTALAMACPAWRPASGARWAAARGAQRSVVGLLGAGSGLGVSGLIPAADGWVALGTEGGHTSFSPRDEREIAILRYGLKLYPHLSHERLLSGPGMELIYRALRDRAGLAPQDLAAPEITRPRWTAATPCVPRRWRPSAPCSARWPSNLAVTLGALGGIYIGGGIVPRLGEYFDRSPFRARFEDKGRFSDYCGHPDLRDHRRARHLRGRVGHPGAAAAQAAGRPGLGHAGDRSCAHATTCRRPSGASPTTCWRIRARRWATRLPRSRARPRSASPR